MRGPHRFVSVDCDCGTVGHWCRWASVRVGSTRSCGCVRRKRAAGLNRSHGQTSVSATAIRRSEYNIWHSMKLRCHTPGSSMYYRYGAVGISVCDRWRDSFEAFISDMGPRPSMRHSVDRIDGRGNYEPGNCRWATYTEQANNRRDNHLITIGGRTQNVSQWAQEYGLKKNQVYNRLALGWTPLKALTTPIQGASPRQSTAAPRADRSMPRYARRP